MSDHYGYSPDEIKSFVARAEAAVGRDVGFENGVEDFGIGECERNDANFIVHCDKGEARHFADIAHEIYEHAHGRK